MFEYRLTAIFHWKGTMLCAGKVQVGHIRAKANKYLVYDYNKKLVGETNHKISAETLCEASAIENLEKFEKDT